MSEYIHYLASRIETRKLTHIIRAGIDTNNFFSFLSFSFFFLSFPQTMIIKKQQQNNNQRVCVYVCVCVCAHAAAAVWPLEILSKE